MKHLKTLVILTLQEFEEPQLEPLKPSFHVILTEFPPRIYTTLRQFPPRNIPILDNSHPVTAPG